MLEQIHQLHLQDGFDYKDFAVMYRTNAQSRAMEQAFVNASTPYVLVGGVGFYKRREVKDMLAYLRLIHNTDDRISFERIVNVPARGIGKKSLAAFLDWVTGMGISIGDGSLTCSTAIRRRFPPRRKRNSATLPIAHSLARDGESGRFGEYVRSNNRANRYYIYLDESSNLPEEGAERADNVRELRGLLQYAVEYEQPLHEFLAEQALVADVDTLKEGADAVTLMTLHSRKGAGVSRRIHHRLGDGHPAALPFF